MFRSTPMTHGGKRYGPWPLLSNNVHLFRYWLLCVINDNGNAAPSRSLLLDADFFDCPQQPLSRIQPSGSDIMTKKLPRSIVETIEAVQELGVTKCGNNTIDQFSKYTSKYLGVKYIDQLILGTTLNGLWGKYYPIQWNSQQFAIRLAYLILRGGSRPAAIPVLIDLQTQLANARQDFIVARHLSCMGAFAGFGVATLGLGVFFAWGTAGGSLVSEGVAQKNVWDRMNALEQAFVCLRDIQI